ncbi:MAG: tetratricopeptide repeat protein, partial [Nitrospina sp.]|nr:tetratricopeptide repeat protein [Nitrospina sp.]
MESSKIILRCIGTPKQPKTSLVFLLSIVVVFSMVSVVQAKTAEEWYTLAFEQNLAGKREKAIRSYQQVLRLKNNWPQAHHNLALLFYRLKNGVMAVHHLRLAEKLYLTDSDPESNRNLKIVKKNLQKTYAEFDINPEEFEELDAMHPVSPSSTWSVKGHGFVLDGYVFTLAHSLGDQEEVRVRIENQPPISARIVKRYIVYDLALLKLETKKPGYMFGDSSIYRVGDSLESPESKGEGAGHSSWRKGVITGLSAIMNDKNMFELELPFPPVPGSPLLNEGGKVAGIILSTPQIVKNFQAAGLPPEGSIALKSSYLSRVFSLYKNSLEGPKRKTPGRHRPDSDPFTVQRNSALAVIEGRTQESP